MSSYRVLVTGSRSWARPTVVYEALDEVLAEHEPLIVVHGANARGADNMAQGWALDRRHTGRFVAYEPHPADWKKHGRRAAGFIRNQEMVDAGADECVAFLMPCMLPSCAAKPPHASHGASDCAGRARKAGIPVTEFRPLTRKEPDGQRAPVAH